MKNPHAQSLGKLGGLKTLEKYGNDYLAKLSRKAVEAKKRKLSEKAKIGMV